LSANNSPAVL